jgi:methylated-DNA-[protein]-cysteine S-methyltransferase
MGWMAALASDAGLLALALPAPSSQEAAQRLKIGAEACVSSPSAFGDLPERLTAYFDGRPVPFPDPLDLSGATAFRRAVWEATRAIPFGRTKSYRQVAEAIGKPGAARAVGQALGDNHLPIIIPCHRVVASDGGLGGYTGGLDFKRRLLSLEAAPLVGIS